MAPNCRYRQWHACGIRNDTTSRVVSEIRDLRFEIAGSNYFHAITYRPAPGLPTVSTSRPPSTRNSPGPRSWHVPAARARTLTAESSAAGAKTFRSSLIRNALSRG